MDREATLALARDARRVLIKVGQDILRFEVEANPLTEAQIRAYLVHDDGFLRVPVLVLGNLLVRGFTDELYHEVLEGTFEEGGSR